MANQKEVYTISFNEDIKGWTSFHSFSPEWMIGMNNQFYSFNGGNLFQHYTNENRNEFYGVSYPSKLSVMVNMNPSVIKELQNVSLEGNTPWDIIIKAYKSDIEDFTNSTLNRTEFNNKEGIWYTYARRNEAFNQTDSKAVYGIGTILSIVGTVVEINGFSDVITIGDTLYNITMQPAGIIQNITRNGSITTVTLDVVNSIIIGDYVIGGKDPRIEGGNLRGYTIRFDLEISSSQRVELFALNANVIKSFP